MTPHDLTLEELGYTHARLHQPIASANPHYQRGYRQGERDRERSKRSPYEYRQNFQNFQKGHSLMWSVWFYAPGSGRRFMDRFNTRSEAESYRQRFLRLVGAGFQAVVCFDP